VRACEFVLRARRVGWLLKDETVSRSGIRDERNQHPCLVRPQADLRCKVPMERGGRGSVRGGEGEGGKGAEEERAKERWARAGRERFIIIRQGDLISRAGRCGALRRGHTHTHTYTHAIDGWWSTDFSLVCMCIFTH
jgi:hypothetical protein